MSPLPLYLIGILFIFGIQGDRGHSDYTGRLEEKVCIGTKGRMSVPRNRSHHYRNLKERYINCTYVEGNLELTWLQDKDMDITFLQNIREVTGYVLISHVDVKRIVLKNLQVIRGRTLFRLNVQDDEFALMVTLSQMENLELPNLRDVLRGNVGVYNNYNLCHIKTINWDEIISDPSAKYVFVYNYSSKERQCAPCHPSCEAGCWGEGPQNCQKFSKINCSPQCHEGRCYGPEPRQCCHLSCAGGCSGPKKSDCIACKKFNDDGECKDECPSLVIYNPNKYLSEKNPNGKYAYGATCVKTCPNHLLRDDGAGACVRQCPPDKEAVHGECVPCNGPCRKKCPAPADKGIVHSGNIDGFRNCTIIEGSIAILETSFAGFQQVHSNYSLGDKYAPMHPSKLNAFRTLKEITGHLNIQGTHPNFTDLSYFECPASASTLTVSGAASVEGVNAITGASALMLLLTKGSLVAEEITRFKLGDSVEWQLQGIKAMCFAICYIGFPLMHLNGITYAIRNLEIIGGREKTEYFESLFILKSSLKSLKLKSLKEIRSGMVRIVENSDLCFADTIDWKKILQEKEKAFVIQNKPLEECRKIGAVCSSQCSREGCWGPEPSDCLSCAKYKLDNQCVPSCNSTIGVYEDSDGICKHCDVQCDGGCEGPGPRHCLKCKNVRDGPFCVESCPAMKYRHPNGTCIACHPNCLEGCTGPANEIANGGCNSCHHAIVIEDHIGKCLGKDETCPPGYYFESLSPKEKGSLKPLAGKSVCKKCHPRCKECTGYGFHTQVCQICSYYIRGEQCEEECPANYFADEELRSCIPCSDECRNCTAEGPDKCTSCRNYRIYHNQDEKNGSFTCTKHCPPDFPHKAINDDEHYCSSVPVIGIERQKSAIIWGILVTVVILFVLIFSAIVYCMKSKAKEDRNKSVLEMISKCDDNEPLYPPSIRPNLNMLIPIKEEDIKIYKKLGSGAFGTVYSGLWYPKGTNGSIQKDNKPFPVAIKILTEVNNSEEFLHEAYIMASVNHPHLLRLLGVCLGNTLKLITPLAFMGCLREFCQTYRTRIGSKKMLEWCVQMAKGMEYLESRRLVHRDLALRNVLVQRNHQIKITDFGLAQMLSLNQDEFIAESGKMPIKWLAIECIKDRTYTHKSDVWAYGVTVWELLTYGKKPYEDTEPKRMLQVLLAGERLNQPSICSLELYMLLIKTWLLDPTQRPSFQYLVGKFTEMSREPNRYIAIQHDLTLDLPKYNQNVEKELFRNLETEPDVVLGTSDTISKYIDASSSCTTSTNDSLKRTMSPTENAWNEGSRRKLHFDHQNPDHRYCSDPVKVNASEMCDMTLNSQAPLSTTLPVDEEDYLVPRPPNSSSCTSYIDVLSDSKELRDSRGKGAKFQKNKFSLVIDNPEYQLTSDRDRPQYANCQSSGSLNTFGLPTLSEDPYRPRYDNRSGSSAGSSRSSQGPVFNNVILNAQKPGLNSGTMLSYFNNSTLPVARQGSRSEEESDHEYYNDFEKQKEREREPLKRTQRPKNETTV